MTAMDPTGMTTALRPLGAVAGGAGNKIQQKLADDNVVATNARGAELAEQVQETNQRHMQEGLIDGDKAATNAQDAKKYGQGIVDTQEKPKHNLGAMHKAKKNENGLQKIEAEQLMLDAKVRHSKNDEKADQVIAEASGK